MRKKWDDKSVGKEKLGKREKWGKQKSEALTVGQER